MRQNNGWRRERDRRSRQGTAPVITVEVLSPRSTCSVAVVTQHPRAADDHRANRMQHQACKFLHCTRTTQCRTGAQPRHTATVDAPRLMKPSKEAASNPLRLNVRKVRKNCYLHLYHSSTCTLSHNRQLMTGAHTYATYRCKTQPVTI